MYFQYDSNGTPLGFVLNGTQYFYITNQMGDVIVIVEADGEPVCEYVYNEWGEIIEIIPVDEENAQQVAVANANPLRYRGYYYDTETGYYYLQSRYYDPSICRFINADIPEIAHLSKDISAGTNLFAYCSNDPVNNVDYDGHLSINQILQQFKSLVGWLTNKLINYIKNLVTYNKYTKILSISTDLISAVIDSLVVLAIRATTYRLIKSTMKTLLKNGKIRNAFIIAVFDFFLYNKVGKVLLWTVAQIAFKKIGMPSVLGTLTGNFMKGFLLNLANIKNDTLKRSISLISVFSSFGGIIAFIFDKLDGKSDNRFNIKLKI